MADACAAAEAGADIIGTTLAGYSGEHEKTPSVYLALIAQIKQANLGLPLMAEGRIYSPADAKAAKAAGADMVCVGTAITHPSTLTKWFVETFI